jgi:hypothetical protein
MFRSSRNGFGFSGIAYVGMRKYLFLFALAGAYLAGRADVSRSAKPENARVRVTELNYEPGQPGARSIRASDKVIVFPDDSKYERIDPDTGAKQVRKRTSGEVIWHNKGEIAPVLTNLEKKTHRTLVIELK